MKIGDRMYRYEAVHSPVYDVKLCTYKIVKFTPKGCYVAIPHKKNKLVLNDAVYYNRFCYETRKDALESFIRKKEWQIQKNTKELIGAKVMLAIACEMAEDIL